MNRRFEIKNLFSFSRKNSVRLASFSILLVLTIAALIWKTGTASVNAAQELPLEEVRCPSSYRVESLRGCYGWRSNESRVGNQGNFIPTVGVGLMSFDGTGALTGAYTGNFDGIPVKRSCKGFYTMNPNGTGILHFDDNMGGSANYEFVMVDGINELFLVETDKAVQQTLVMKKQ